MWAQKAKAKKIQNMKIPIYKKQNSNIKANNLYFRAKNQTQRKVLSTIPLFTRKTEKFYGC